MKIKATFRALVTLLFSLMVVTSSANTLDSGPINFQGGIVLPNKTLYIPLSFLTLGRYYKITCDIENPNYTKQYPVILSLSSNWAPMSAGSDQPKGGVGGIKINGHTPSRSQALLDQFENKYEAADVWISFRSGSELRLVFQNFDDKDTVTVKNCIAMYVI